MQMRYVDYEWRVEDIAPDGDILDSNGWPSYADAVANATPAPGRRCGIVLVRDDARGRQWAVVADGKLPEYFRDEFDREGSRVPSRFHAEVREHWIRWMRFRRMTSAGKYPSI